MTRTSDILAQLALTKQQIERERQRGAQSGDFASRVAAAIPATISTLADVGGKALGGAIERRAGELSTQAVKPEGAVFVSDVGAPQLVDAYTETPEAAASKSLAGVKPEGWLDEVFGITNTARAQALKAISQREAERRAQERASAERELERATKTWTGEQERKQRVSMAEADLKARADAAEADRKARREDTLAQQRFLAGEHKLDRELARERDQQNKALAQERDQQKKEDEKNDPARIRAEALKLDMRKDEIDSSSLIGLGNSLVDDLRREKVEVGKLDSLWAKMRRPAFGTEAARGLFKANLLSWLTQMGRKDAGGVLSDDEFRRVSGIINTEDYNNEGLATIIEAGTRRKEDAHKALYQRPPIDLKAAAGEVQSPTRETATAPTARDALRAAIAEFEGKNGRKPNSEEVRQIAGRLPR